MEQGHHSSKRILILGGSGRMGKLVITAALQRGYLVTALVRSANSLSPQPGLTVIEGSPLNSSDIADAFRQTSDAPSFIISTLGQTRRTGNPWSAATSPPLLTADSIRNAIDVAKGYNLKKIVVVSAFGTGASMQNLNFLMRAIMRWSNMKVTVEDHNAVDQLVKNSGVCFVLARSAMLMGENLAPVQFLGDEGEKAGLMPSISRYSVTEFLMDALESDEWDMRTPVISN